MFWVSGCLCVSLSFWISHVFGSQTFFDLAHAWLPHCFRASQMFWVTRFFYVWHILGYHTFLASHIFNNHILLSISLCWNRIYLGFSLFVHHTVFKESRTCTTTPHELPCVVNWIRWFCPHLMSGIHDWYISFTKHVSKNSCAIPTQMELFYELLKEDP